MQKFLAESQNTLLESEVKRAFLPDPRGLGVLPAF